ncbi:ABC transporter permease subunit [Paenibacillus aceris]|uniref:ABC-type dipeptide/oligopeptide/nickel transport system permease component n=1 Tax=Paenibacillus aceris TaxID=869555 RepID=A0ABS4HZI1_9BACL|nr:ABC transporter permease subunit [Paenibacillus aceris]MBP1964064.1 ABC-type dipeptide/oligopeptide/nickel transport system permease component [Paenibacillus aceris]NHW34521.1 ABC transporter permease subunit [Paenibacillus aceris]
MKSTIRWLLLGVFTLVCIFFLSNIQNAFLSTQPDQIRVTIGPDTSIQRISEQLPGSRVLNEKSGLLAVPYGKAWDYVGKTLTIKGIFRATTVPLEHPVISWRYFGYSVKDQIQGFFHGDFGKFRNPFNRQEVAVIGELPVMLLRTCTYFIPGLLMAIVLSMLMAMLASMWRRLGAVLDGVQALLVGLPDFFLIVLIQLGAIYATKFLGHYVLLIVQVGDKTPFLIPFLTIALIPSVTIYGTMRVAIMRELGQDYVVTAQAKGLTRGELLVAHVLRNVMLDLLSVLPKATTLALASMAVAEAICGISGLGGFIISPALQSVSSMSVICMSLALLAMAFHVLYALLRKKFIVRTGGVVSQ